MDNVCAAKHHLDLIASNAEWISDKGIYRTDVTDEILAQLSRISLEMAILKNQIHTQYINSPK